MNNKTIVITGAAGILCEAIAIALAKQGANIAVLDLRKDAADGVANKINKEGGNAIGVEANVLIKESLVKAHQTVQDHFGNCDILINGAGGNHPKGTASNTHLTLENFKDTNPESTTFLI